MIIELTEYELRHAAQVGFERRLQQLLRKSQTTVRSTSRSVEETDMVSAMAEMAAAKALNLHWSAGVDTFKEADIGRHTQVRWTDRDNGCLILRPRDDPAQTYVLVTGEPPVFTLRGWISGYDGMLVPPTKAGRDEYPEAWFVAQHLLLPMSEFRDILWRQRAA